MDIQVYISVTRWIKHQCRRKWFPTAVRKPYQVFIFQIYYSKQQNLAQHKDYSALHLCVYCSAPTSKKESQRTHDNTLFTYAGLTSHTGVYTDTNVTGVSHSFSSVYLPRHVRRTRPRPSSRSTFACALAQADNTLQLCTVLIVLGVSVWFQCKNWCLMLWLWVIVGRGCGYRKHVTPSDNSRSYAAR